MISLNDKKIFIVGATGMVGTALLKKFIAEYKDFTIYALVHTIPPRIYHQNIRYIHIIPDTIPQCDYAIMAASNAGGAKHVQLYPYDHGISNLNMNIDLLNLLVRSKCKRILFIGSSAIYQPFEGMIKEDELDLNKEPSYSYLGFGYTMRYIENMCKTLNKKLGIEFVIARASNIFGPYDKFNPDKSNFIPAIIRKVVDQQNPLELWGTPDVMRDVIYVEKFVNIILSLLFEHAITFDTFNVGSGEPISVSDVVHHILEYCTFNPEIKWDKSKPTTIKYRALDCDKLRQTVNGSFLYTVKEGINKTIDWWLQNKDTWEK